ncbi:E3 ubiquitin-protein ligase KEG [Heracleum sosnowskyi]|uniref:E3 ubiquitin-protein ligase KEG n=1 Tax=Heracleum sosnowskyi TaxID=360622 RepID=A0AAD8ICA2_9APIA|nr:E3 ubiquitin-protein ligase KEG [Heracleum sosnowskyi]
MAGQVAFNQLSAPSEDFEIVYNDVDEASKTQFSPLIDPATIILKHRLGRGPFGDVWLATLRHTAEDYEEYHAVAVKMLHHIKKDSIKTVLDHLAELLYKSRGLKGACWLYGASVITGKVCIVMKFYEGSVGDKMAHLKEGKLPLADVLRYGIELARGIMELHSKEIMVLNLKPFNFLLDENSQLVLGDLGVPYVLKGIPLPSSDMTYRLGTPNYMAPEQWEPETRGPLSYETDSWGFACSIVEMLTGTLPWYGMSVYNIYHAVVEKQEKPFIPEDLPPEVKKVIIGCFEYDFRSRPSMSDILHAFKSAQNAISSDRGRISLDNFQVGDMVRSRKLSNYCKPENMDVPKGIVVGLERDTDPSAFVLVRLHAKHDPVRVQASTLEQVTYGFVAGDWVSLKKKDKKHSPVGILHFIHRDGAVGVAFIGLDTLWKGSCTDIEKAETCCVGEFVKLKSNVYRPRFEWPRKGGAEWATGRICQILPNGCLVVNFPGRLTIRNNESSSFLADPAEVEVVSFKTCPDMVKKYQHLEDFHWAVRPVMIGLGLFTAMKLGSVVGKGIGSSKVKKDQKLRLQEDSHQVGAQRVNDQTANGFFRFSLM